MRGVGDLNCDWRVWQESNLRPLASEANTLSTELQTLVMPSYNTR